MVAPKARPRKMARQVCAPSPPLSRAATQAFESCSGGAQHSLGRLHRRYRQLRALTNNEVKACARVEQSLQPT